MKVSQIDKAIALEGEIAVLEAAVSALRQQQKQAPIRRVASSAVAKVKESA